MNFCNYWRWNVLDIQVYINSVWIFMTSLWLQSTKQYWYLFNKWMNFPLFFSHIYYMIEIHFKKLSKWRFYHNYIIYEWVHTIQCSICFFKYILIRFWWNLKKNVQLDSDVQKELPALYGWNKTLFNQSINQKNYPNFSSRLENSHRRGDGP